MTVGRTFYAGIVAGIVSFIMTFAADGHFFEWVYLALPGAEVWTDAFNIWIILLLFFTSIVMSFAFTILKESVPGVRMSKGIIFGVIVWLVSTVPISIFLLIASKSNAAVPVYWIISGLVKNSVIGMVLAGFLTEKEKKQIY